jgi:hypothetical protein
MECKGQWHRGPWHFGNIARSHIIYTRSYSWPDKQVHMYTFYWKSFQVSLYSHRQRRGLLIYACAAAARALSGRTLEAIAFLDGRASHHFQTLLQTRPYRTDCGADVPGDDNVKIRLVLYCRLCFLSMLHLSHRTCVVAAILRPISVLLLEWMNH